MTSLAESPRPESTTGDPGLTVAFVGAGARGAAYAEIVAEFGHGVEIVAVAEPRPIARNEFADTFNVPAENVFEDWKDLAAVPRLADVVVIGLVDQYHVEATLAFAHLGYNILLEKPMAPTEAECEVIADAVERAGVHLAVCHVMRYTPYTLALQALLREGVIGDIVNVEHLEPIGHTHYAHSFTRGNWRREEDCGSLLLSKSCHDIDWLCAIVDQPVVRVASFGSLTHFRKEARPAGAADRCIDCQIEPSCPYSAPRFYRDRGLINLEWGVSYATKVMAGELTEEAVARALAEGPYGRCVYDCDNDLVDHQVVQMEFGNGALASFTMTAFSEGANRKTKLFGTKGQITGDGQNLEIFDFLTLETTHIDTDAAGYAAADGHAGGDAGLVQDYLRAMLDRDPERVPTDVKNSLASHRVVFAAERARLAGAVVSLDA